MKQVIGYIKDYWNYIPKQVLFTSSCFTALFIFLNYYYRIDHRINQTHSFITEFGWRWLQYAMAAGIPWLLFAFFRNKNYWRDKTFTILFLAAPALFSLKLALDIPLSISSNPNWNNYWNHILYWPVLALIISLLILGIRKTLQPEEPLYGFKTKGINWRPYLIMLMIMLPLVTLASTQPDFLAVYPKLKAIASVYNEPGITTGHKILFELSYGSDFFTIEFFFRGFMVLAFLKFGGKDAILPMAFFYCTIHFGKPLGECIGSYFGGMILGIIVAETRSIWGGLMIHLGIAWLMEAGGYIGNSL